MKNETKRIIKIVVTANDKTEAETIGNAICESLREQGHFASRVVSEKNSIRALEQTRFEIAVVTKETAEAEKQKILDSRDELVAMLNAVAILKEDLLA